MKSNTVMLVASILAVVLLSMGSTCMAMEVSDLDSGRRIDWTRVGYQGAIPDIDTNIVDVTGQGAAGDGVTDDAAAIQSAIDNMAVPGVIYLPGGIYRIESPISLKSGVVLRGDGHGSTGLECRSASGCLSVRGATNGSYVALSGGAAMGATQIMVSDASRFEAGQGGQIRQDDIVAAQASWGEGSVGQMVRIMAVNGNTLTIEPPLHLEFSMGRHPEIRPIRFIEQVGVEELAIKRLDSGNNSSNNIQFRYAADCWVRQVESDWTEKYHFSASESLHLEIRECYIHDAKSRGGGGNGYGVSLARHATSILVENNIFYDMRHSMIIQMGANGCVFGYNYSERNYSDDDGGWAKTHISLHGHYPFMNLFEGNIVAWAGVGDYWGPIGPGNTLFRNRVLGTDRFDGIGDRHGLAIGYIHGPQNIIGNEVTGGSIYTSATISHPGVHYPDEWIKVLYHGNNEKGTVSWDGAMPDQVLPPSFYRNVKPLFMGDLPWPAMGGDLPLNQGTIPAKQRFDSGDVIPGASSSDPGPDPGPNQGQSSGGAVSTGGSGGSSGCFVGSMAFDDHRTWPLPGPANQSSTGESP